MNRVSFLRKVLLSAALVFCGMVPALYSAQAAPTAEDLLLYLNSRATGDELVMNPDLQEAAEEKSDQMEVDKWVVAVDQDGRDYFYLPYDYGYTPYSSMGLNVLSSWSDDPADWVADWQKSSVYGANMSRILSGEYGDIGIGITEGMVYKGTFQPPQPGYFITLYFAEPVTPPVINGNTKPALQTRDYWAIFAGTTFDPADMALCYDAEDGELPVTSSRTFDLSDAPLAHDTKYEVTLTCTDSQGLSSTRSIDVNVKGGDGVDTLIIGTRNLGSVNDPPEGLPWINVQNVLRAEQGVAFDARDEAFCFPPTDPSVPGTLVALPQSSLTVDQIIPATAVPGKYYVTLECFDEQSGLNALPRKVSVTVPGDSTNTGNSSSGGSTYPGGSSGGTNTGGGTYPGSGSYTGNTNTGGGSNVGGNSGGSSGGGIPSKLVPCDGPICEFCHFVQLLSNVVKWLIAVLFLVFGVVAAVAGWKLVTSAGNIAAVESAKKMIVNALIGIVLVLAAWLIVDTIIRGLLGSDNVGGYWLWWEIDCANQQAATAPGTGAGTETPPGTCPVTPISDITDSLALQMEGGQSVIWNNDTLKTCVDKFTSQVGGVVTSAYRPPEYQAHLYEVSTKACELSKITDGSCDSVKSAIEAERTKHGLPLCGAVAQSNSTHSSGNGVDISGIAHGTPSVQAAAADSCLEWKNYSNDPYHYDLKSGCSCN